MKIHGLLLVVLVLAPVCLVSASVGEFFEKLFTAFHPAGINVTNAAENTTEFSFITTEIADEAETVATEFDNETEVFNVKLIAVKEEILLDSDESTTDATTVEDTTLEPSSTTTASTTTTVVYKLFHPNTTSTGSTTTTTLSTIDSDSTGTSNATTSSSSATDESSTAAPAITGLDTATPLSPNTTSPSEVSSNSSTASTIAETSSAVPTTTVTTTTEATTTEPTSTATSSIAASSTAAPSTDAPKTTTVSPTATNTTYQPTESPSTASSINQSASSLAQPLADSSTIVDNVLCKTTYNAETNLRITSCSTSATTPKSQRKRSADHNVEPVLLADTIQAGDGSTSDEGFPSSEEIGDDDGDVFEYETTISDS